MFANHGCSNTIEILFIFFMLYADFVFEMCYLKVKHGAIGFTRNINRKLFSKFDILYFSTLGL